ncbi:cysteine-rich venom protein pseudechetoxin-like [Lineus longissimus]|uniref:cysteine-rich venom protein pseudechetoxin-like n=1 Tax=Lineus longissimus TaxID=88925 RepID=UPI00315CA077
MWGWRSIGVCIIFCLSLADADGRVTVKTEQAKPCSFPFIYNGVLNYDCLYGGRPGKAWCSLTPNYEKDKEWGWCDATASPKMETFGGNANGTVCKFPFTYEGKEYKYCISESLLPWCATTSCYDQDKTWGYCSVYTAENQFRPFSPDHVGVLSFGNAEAVDSSTRSTIVQIHNKLRNDVSPTATNMLKMSYDLELENLARKWVNQCKREHPSVNTVPGKAALGQNLFFSEVHETWNTAINAWHNEIKHFTYGTYTTSGVTGHYTQVVWADTSLVGCAMKKCGERNYIYACNYGPGGNYNPAYKPYTKGDAGSSCMNRDSTYKNLCDCGGENICLNNGGAVDTKTCTCNCKEGQVGSRCAIDCGAFKDAWYCSSSYGVKLCTTATNVPFECPKMCGVCP